MSKVTKLKNQALQENKLYQTAIFVWWQPRLICSAVTVLFKLIFSHINSEPLSPKKPTQYKQNILYFYSIQYLYFHLLLQIGVTVKHTQLKRFAQKKRFISKRNSWWLFAKQNVHCLQSIPIKNCCLKNAKINYEYMDTTWWQQIQKRRGPTSCEISPGFIKHTLGAEEDLSLCPKAGLLRWGVFGETVMDWFRLL